MLRKLLLKLRESLMILHGECKISTRFRIVNILLFAVVSAMISIAMLIVLRNISDTVSKDYAKLYSSNAAGTLDAYFGSQIALIKKAAHSNALIEWFDNEYSQEKKIAAYEEMMEIIDSLPSKNLYIGIEKTLHEFTVEESFTIDDIQSFATLEPNYFVDSWYFDCTALDKDYILNVDIDKILHRKRVWLNYKVIRGDTIYGVLCTWLEFSDLVEKLFSEYDCDRMRGLVIDENGVIYMDSTLLGDDDFLHYTIGDEKHIKNEISDPGLISSFNAYIEDMDGYFDLESPTVVVELSHGKYRYATIAPIASTTWSVITLYNASSLFGIANLLPMLVIVLTMFIIYIAVTGFTSKKLIFEPFEQLTHSIACTKGNKHEHIYGIDRRDEIGYIANTVQDMKDSLTDALDKAQCDALTGIYNRWFMDETLSDIIKSLSRSGGVLSVMMIDVDFFKKYNDTYGHSMGDDCLKQIAEALARSIKRPDDFVARYGGEEFVVVLPNTDEKGSRVMANRLLENVGACCVPHEKSDVADHVTVSIGVTMGNVKPTQSGEDYIKRADKALYISKHSGRNRYTFLDFEESIKNDETGERGNGNAAYKLYRNCGETVSGALLPKSDICR